MSSVLPAAAAAVVGLVPAIVGPSILRRLPPPKTGRKPPTELPNRPGGASVVADSVDPSEPAALPDPGPVTNPYPALAERASTRPSLLVLGIAAGLIVGSTVGWGGAWPAWTFLAAVGVLLGYIDSRTSFLPTAIIAPAYVVAAVLLVVGALAADDADRLLPAVYGWAAYGGFFLLMWIVYPAGIGYGDVRLAGLLGLPLGYVGWGATITALYSGLVLGAVGGGLLILLRLVASRRYPYGPFMLLGALVGLVWGQSFGEWYGSI